MALITIEELATTLKLSKNTVYQRLAQWEKTGLKILRRGNLIRIESESIGTIFCGDIEPQTRRKGKKHIKRPAGSPCLETCPHCGHKNLPDSTGCKMCKISFCE